MPLYEPPSNTAIDFTQPAGTYAPPNGANIGFQFPSDNVTFTWSAGATFNVVADGTVTRTLEIAGTSSVSLVTKANANIGMAISGTTTTFFEREAFFGWNGSAAIAFSSNLLGARAPQIKGKTTSDLRGAYQSIGRFVSASKTTLVPQFKPLAKAVFSSSGAGRVYGNSDFVANRAFAIAGQATYLPELAALRTASFSVAGAGAPTWYGDRLRDAAYSALGVGYANFVSDYTYAPLFQVPDADTLVYARPEKTKSVAVLV